jgi:serine/threonine protein kinase
LYCLPALPAPLRVLAFLREHTHLHSQEEIIHEAQTMKSYHHPNVLPLYTSFVHGQELLLVRVA